MPSNQEQPQTEVQAPPSLPPVDSSGSSLANSPVPVNPADKDKDKKPSTLTARKVFRSYVVPLGVLAIFGAMLLFLIIPKISDIIAQLDLTTQKYDQARTMDNELKTLSSLQLQGDTFQISLNTINQIAPSGGTEVVNFQKKILDLAKGDNLIVQQSSLEESVKQAEDKTSVASLGIIEIPSTFSLKGAFVDLQKFVSQIRDLSDFVIIGEMALRANLDPNAAVDGLQSTASEWNLIITLIKYQFIAPTAANQLETVFKNIPLESKINEKVLEFANNKVQRGLDVQQLLDNTSVDTSGTDVNTTTP